MSEQIQGVIKCGRGEGGFEYSGHNRAGLFFDRHGREFIVDDKPVAKLRDEAEKDLAAAETAIEKIKLERGPSSPATLQQEERAEGIRARIRLLKAGYVDEPGKPLVVTKKLYEYLREVNGKALVFDHWDGKPREPPPPETAKLSDGQRLSVLEEGQRELRGMFQELLDRLKK